MNVLCYEANIPGRYLTILTLGYFTWCLNLPPPKKKEEGKGGEEPNFALNLKLNFRVLIRPY